MHEYESRVIDALKSPRAYLAAFAVLGVFALSVLVSPLAAAVVLAPLAVIAALAAAPNETGARAREAARSTMNSTLNRHTRNGRRLSILDPQTGLLQRWYFELRVADEARRSRRYGVSMAMLYLKVEADVAHANDPDWNIDAQMDLVQVLARQMRGVDLASRTAEREFALCLPHTGEEGALSLAWRISQNVGAYTMTMRKAVAPDNGFDFEALYGASEIFTPQQPISKPLEQPSTHLQLVQMVKNSPYGEVPITEGQTPRAAKTKLRRASKRAGVEIRIWEANGVLHFEHVDAQKQAGVA
jgi:GGDEF domain-containing protein